MPSAKDESDSPPAPGAAAGSESRWRLTEEQKAELRRDMPKIFEQMRQTGELPPNPDHLSQSEKEQLRRVGEEQDEYARKAFKHLREGRTTDGASDPVSGMLTSSEKEELRRVGQQQSEKARAAFAHLRPKDGVKSSPDPVPDQSSRKQPAVENLPLAPEMLTADEIEELRRIQLRQCAAAEKAFAHLRPKTGE